MYGKFVGLDIGSDSIKIVLVKKGFRDLELLETKQIKTPETTQGMLDVLNDFFTQHSLPKTDVATSIPANPISIRVLNFPFSDPKKIDEVYESELENVSTFDPAERVHGYHLVKRENEAEAIVCMFNKEDVRNPLSAWHEVEIDPKVVTFTPIAFSALDWFVVGERPLLLIDIGASQIAFSLFDKEGMRRVRSSSKAGRSVTETLSKLLGVSFEEAEAIKHSGLRSGQNSAVREALVPIINEIKKTIQFFEMELKKEIKTLILSGGMSLMPGIANYIAKELKKETVTISIPDLGAKGSPLYAKAFALALYGSDFRRGYLNLRKGEFEYAAEGEELRKTFMLPALLLALFILLSVYRAGDRYFEMKSEVKQMEAQINRSVKEAFPNVGVIPKPVVFMENEVKKVRSKLDLYEGLAGGPTPLDILRDISESIPPDVKLGVDEVNYLNDGTVRILGKCSSSEEVARIEKVLADSGKFKKVVRDSTETAVNNTIKFRISLVVDNEYKRSF